MKFLLVFPDGIGLRNFALTDFLSHLLRRGQVIVWHRLPPQPLKTYAQYAAQADWQPLPWRGEGQIAALLRRTKLLAQLLWQNEPGTEQVLESLSRVRGKARWRHRLALFGAFLFSRQHKHILQIEAAHQAVLRLHPTYRLSKQRLQQEAPDVVFCSHQRSELAAPVMLAAQDLNIPTATFIYSWDNLPKGRMAVSASQYLVWSEHMRQEMRQYYPEIAPERVQVVGTPQFEAYFRPQHWQDREFFLREMGLDPARRVICFSGDDQGTSPHDPDYLEDVANAVLSLSPDIRPQILFRRTPTDISGRYRQAIERHPEIACQEPAWVNLAENDWTKVIPTAEDTRLLVNTVRHCDLTLNVGSTMALDFAILHKPAIYLAYAPASWQPNEPWSIEKVYRYPHFNHLPQFEPVLWARKREDLPGLIRSALQNPNQAEENRRRWVEFLVRPPLEAASLRMAETLISLAQRQL